ncbi:MAG: hypothetical protein Kow0029_00850 [Candidatus Rifleibacteriota bacterium]
MFELILGMTFLEKIFLTCALCGSVVFLIRMMLMFIGLAGDHGDGHLDSGGHDGGHDMIGDGHDIGHDFDGDISHDGDLGVDHGELVETNTHSAGHSIDDSDASFKFVSIQGLTAFFMMFGWVGLALIRDNALPGWAAVAGGFVGGAFTVYVLAVIFKFAMKLQSDGTMRIKSALGSGGTVYLRIPADGIGQVQVEVDGRLKVFDAVSSTKEEIKTGEQITVVWVQDNGVLVVEKDERERGGKLCGL